MLKLHHKQGLIEAGCDEAGRGCLAGPVFAAAVILPNSFKNSMLTDSKQLNLNQREELRHIIEEQALSFAVAKVDPKEIDRINILRASILAMHKALDLLTITPQFLLIDGNKFTPYKEIPFECIVKGDANYLSIAAASVLAKTYRDEYMVRLDKTFPQYQWRTNKGYPTKKHREAIEIHGITQHHRKTFRLTTKQLEVNFEKEIN